MGVKNNTRQEANLIEINITKHTFISVLWLWMLNFRKYFRRLVSWKQRFSCLFFCFFLLLLPILLKSCSKSIKEIEKGKLTLLFGRIVNLDPRSCSKSLIAWYVHAYKWGACGVTVIFVGNWQGKSSSIPERCCLHFT